MPRQRPGSVDNTDMPRAGLAREARASHRTVADQGIDPPVDFRARVGRRHEMLRVIPCPSGEHSWLFPGAGLSPGD